MWTPISGDDPAGLQNLVNIMRQMDSHYATLDVQEIANIFLLYRGEAWHYQGNGFELVMLFQYSAQRGYWQLSYLGFVGNVQPSDALVLAIERVHMFLQSHGLSYVYAFRPTTVEYTPLEQLHDLVPQNPLLRVMVMRQTDEGVMWQIEYIGPPAGSLSTAAQWLHVTPDDESLVRRWYEVMYQMNDSYRRESVASFDSWPGHREEQWGGAYYYWLPDAEIAVRFRYSGARREFELMSVGFVGNLTPAVALDLVIDKAVDFLRSQHGSSGFARRPKHMKDPRIMQLHDLVPQHPRLRVTVEKDVPAATRWKIEIPELLNS